MAAPMVPSSANPNRIARESLSNAISSLLKWTQSQPKHEKSQLFEADDIIYLILTLTRIPSSGRTNPYRIPIPHPLHPFDPQSTSICFIVDDRPSSPLSPATALDQIRTRNLPIASVIGLTELKSDYRPYESRRKLCDSYDLFFADRKIIPLLPRLLGKHFFKRKKIPLAVDSSRVGWSEQIKSWCESSLLYLRTGTCSGLKIGRVNQTVDEIVENAVAAIEGAMEYVPKKWGNLRSVHVKTVESVALPVYQVVPEIGLKIEGVWDEERKGRKRVRAEEKEEKKAKKEKKGRIHDVVEGLDEDEGGVGDDGDVVESEEVVVEKSAKKKKGDKGKKRVLDEEGGDEENVVGELSEKSKKKKKMEMDAVVVAKGVEKSKAKKKKKRGDDDDDGNVVVNDDLGAVKEVKKGGKAKKVKGRGDDGVAEENVASDISAKKTKKKKLVDVVVASDGMKKGKAKSQRRKM